MKKMKQLLLSCSLMVGLGGAMAPVGAVNYGALDQNREDGTPVNMDHCASIFAEDGAAAAALAAQGPIQRAVLPNLTSAQQQAVAEALFARPANDGDAAKQAVAAAVPVVFAAHLSEDAAIAAALAKVDAIVGNDNAGDVFAAKDAIKAKVLAALTSDDVDQLSAGAKKAFLKDLVQDPKIRKNFVERLEKDDASNIQGSVIEALSEEQLKKSANSFVLNLIGKQTASLILTKNLKKAQEDNQKAQSALTQAQKEKKEAKDALKKAEKEKKAAEEEMRACKGELIILKATLKTLEDALGKSGDTPATPTVAPTPAPAPAPTPAPTPAAPAATPTPTPTAPTTPATSTVPGGDTGSGGSFGEWWDF
jgi:hypothetical protein